MPFNHEFQRFADEEMFFVVIDFLSLASLDIHRIDWPSPASQAQKETRTKTKFGENIPQ